MYFCEKSNVFFLINRLFLIYFEIEICKSVKLQEKKNIYIYIIIKKKKNPTDPKVFKLLLTFHHMFVVQGGIKT